MLPYELPLIVIRIRITGAIIERYGLFTAITEFILSILNKL